MARIDYFFATLSPYCYLAGQRLEGVGARHPAAITDQSFDLAASFVAIGSKVSQGRIGGLDAYLSGNL